MGKELGWRFPLDEARSVMELAESFAVPIADELREAAQKIPGPRERPPSLVPSSLPWWEQLYPFQKEGVAHLLRHPHTILGDDLGLGKSIQSLTACLAWNYLPILILCPPSLVDAWAVTIKSWGRFAVTYDVIRSGKPRAIRPAQVVICPYSLVRDWEDALVKLRPGALICDEIHNARNKKTILAQSLLHITDSLPNEAMVLGLSATLLVNKPFELIMPLTITRMFDRVVDDSRGKGWEEFVTTYCDGHFNGFNWETDGASNLEQLHARMREAGYLRRLKTTVLAQLPPVVYDTIEVPLTTTQERALRAMEADIVSYLREHTPERADAAQRAEALVRLNEMRKYLGNAKAKHIAAWAREWVENSGQKLLLFAVHREVQQELARLTKAPLLGASLNSRQISATVGAFQEGKHPILVASLHAMSEGLTLTAAGAVAFAELPWTSARFNQAIGRAYGRLNDAHGVLVYLLNAGFIDDTLMELIVAKDQNGAIVQSGTQDSALAGLLASRQEWLDTWSA